MSKFVHMELNTKNVTAAKKFYKSVFGWKFDDMPMPAGVYSLFAGPDGPIGGMQKNPMPKTPPHWLGYIGTKSVTRTIAKIKRNRGKILVPKMDVQGHGSMAIFQDPQGAVFAIWEDAKKKPAKKKTKKKATKRKTAKKKTSKKKTSKKKTSKRKTTRKATKRKPAKRKTTRRR